MRVFVGVCVCVYVCVSKYEGLNVTLFFFLSLFFFFTLPNQYYLHAILINVLDRLTPCLVVVEEKL